VRGRFQYVELAAHLICVVLIAAYLFAYVFLQPVFDADRFGLDLQGYWIAADRLASGREIYASAGLAGNEEYRYSPWFAALFVPLRTLPREAVEVAWVTIGLCVVAWLAWPLRRTPTGLMLAALIVPQMLEYAWLGNVDPLVLAALALNRSRAGPLLVGVAASLKIAPIAFVVTYIVAREWKRAAIALLVAAALWLPALAFDLSLWNTSLTPYSPMSVSLAAGIAWAAILALAALLSARRHPALASSLLVLALTPRLHLYSAGILVIPARDALDRSTGKPGEQTR
jgi:Glycosyltransferase family 87